MNHSFESIQYNEDDRAQRLLNVFPAINGQLNITHVNSTSHIVAWHKHNIQTDYWCCAKGSFKVGLADEDGNVWWEYLSDKNTRVLKIPPGIYHGYQAMEEGSILVYYLTEQYNPEDEIRAKVGDFGESWQTQNK
jgi:dTDP-4-dehydrorhamnose 3,5-epimerase-like enzyme